MEESCLNSDANISKIKFHFYKNYPAADVPERDTLSEGFNFYLFLCGVFFVIRDLSDDQRENKKKQDREQNMKNNAFGLLKKELCYNAYAGVALAFLCVGQVWATHKNAESVYFTLEIIRALALSAYVLYLSYVFAVKKQWVRLSVKSVLSLGFRALSFISLIGIVLVLLAVWQMPDWLQKALALTQEYWRSTLSLSEREITEYSAQFSRQYIMFQVLQVLLFNMLIGIPALLIGAVFMVKRKKK